MVEALQSNVWVGMEFRTESRPSLMASKRGTSFGNTPATSTGRVYTGDGGGGSGGGGNWGGGGVGVGHQSAPSEDEEEESVSHRWCKEYFVPFLESASYFVVGSRLVVARRESMNQGHRRQRNDRTDCA